MDVRKCRYCPAEFRPRRANQVLCQAPACLKRHKAAENALCYYRKNHGAAPPAAITHCPACGRPIEGASSRRRKWCGREDCRNERRKGRPRTRQRASLAELAAWREKRGKVFCACGCGVELVAARGRSRGQVERRRYASQECARRAGAFRRNKNRYPVDELALGAPPRRQASGGTDPIADWIARNGVTRCPTAYAEASTGEISAEERHAHARRYAEIERRRAEKKEAGDRSPASGAPLARAA